ncbi:hypothetical protein [Streptosporangium sp. NPDC002524]|uniref:hypothetical protein n=1 Tax=Streptosporangium sp. NPDC002524 TaxID=3154537 RepID=UPI00331FB956
MWSTDTTAPGSDLAPTAQEQIMTKQPVSAPGTRVYCRTDAPTRHIAAPHGIDKTLCGRRIKHYGRDLWAQQRALVYDLPQCRPCEQAAIRLGLVEGPEIYRATEPPASGFYAWEARMSVQREMGAQWSPAELRALDSAARTIGCRVDSDGKSKITVACRIERQRGVRGDRTHAQQQAQAVVPLLLEQAGITARTQTTRPCISRVTTEEADAERQAGFQVPLLPRR